MNISTINPDDLVEVDIRGHVFDAIVSRREPGELSIDPVRPGISWRRATSRQVRRHWAPRPLRDDGAVSTRALRVDDIVELTVGEDQALARIVSLRRSRMRVRALTRGAPVRDATRAQVTRHYALRGRRRAARAR